MVGPVRASDNAWLAFGHGHIGLSNGPITGEVIGDLLSGRKPGFEITPFAAQRF